MKMQEPREVHTDQPSHCDMIRGGWGPREADAEVVSRAQCPTQATRASLTFSQAMGSQGLLYSSGGVYSLQICVDVSNPSAKPSAKLPQSERYKPRACF